MLCLCRKRHVYNIQSQDLLKGGYLIISLINVISQPNSFQVSLEQKYCICCFGVEVVATFLLENNICLHIYININYGDLYS